MPAFRTRLFPKPNRTAMIMISLSVFLLFPPFSPAQKSGAAGASSGQTASVAGGSSGQAPAGAATADSTGSTALNTTVDEVSLDLTVPSKHNKAVGDLEPSQLAVTDGGTPVQLSSLRQVAAGSGAEHLVALVFDRLGRGTAKPARAIAEKILDVFPAKGYSFAVFQVNGRLRLVQPYTRKHSLVQAALEEATPDSPAAPSADLNAAEKALIDSLHSDSLRLDAAGRAEGKQILSALEQSQRILEESHKYPSLAAIQALVSSDRLLTGRKFIFYFSSGIASSSETRDTIHSIAGLASRDGVTICAVDANPLDVEMGKAMQSAVASSILGKGPSGDNINAFGIAGVNIGSPSGAALDSVGVHNIAGFEFGDIVAGQSPLASLASSTGGVYFRASGGTKHQLQQLEEDLTTWYQASWMPPIKNYDGQFRPIDIRPLRKDVVIHTRSGYFAVPPTEALGIRPFETPLLDILAGSALPTDLKFHAVVLHLGTLPDGESGELTVQVPFSQLEVHEDANTHLSSVHASIMAVIKDSKGEVLQRFGEDHPVRGTPDMFGAGSSEAITLQRHFSADPGEYTLETAVMDRVANKAGAQRTTFTIEPPRQGPALSDIALVRSVEPVEEDSETLEPMRYRDGLVVPDLAAELPADTRSLSLFFLVHPVAGSQSQPALRIQVLRNGQMLTDMPVNLQKVSGTGAAIPYFSSIRGTGFPAGEYEVKALLSQDGSTVLSSASFRVEGAAAAANLANSSLTVDSANRDQADSHLVSEAANGNSRFVMTSPTISVPRPSDAEIEALIEGARKRALAWTDSLENFYCLEVTRHSVDATGHGGWKRKSTLVELMRYVDHAESRKTLLLDGARSDVQPEQLQFAHSGGEFGAMFHIVFDPSAKAVFTWKQSAVLDGQPVEVFAVQVARANSTFDLSDRDNRTAPVGFHGLVYLDRATGSVRRIGIDADDIPRELLIRASSISVDYSWISMQDHDFLLPVRGAVSLQEAKRRAVLNEFEFLNYRRYGSQFRVLTDDQLKSLSKD